MVVFDSTQPLSGAVLVNFDGDAVITDLTKGAMLDPFAPSAAWSYALADILAPVVASAEPVAGSILAALDQLEVNFNEAVSCVDAADPLINGTPATSATNLAPGRYRFEFAAVAAGPANIA